MDPVIIGYWNLRGLAQPIRLLLEYLGVKYQENLYGPDKNGEIGHDWNKDKESLPLIVGGAGESRMELPNLPYYVETKPDGSKLKLTQSIAILRYLGKKHGLAPTCPEEQARLDVIEQETVDLRTAISGYCYGCNFPHKMRFPNYVQDIRTVLQKWEDILDNKKWVLGDFLTYVDFHLFEYLDWHILLDGTIVEAFPNIAAFCERFRKLPAIEAYMKSDRYIDWPLVGPLAPVFGVHRQ